MTELTFKGFKGIEPVLDACLQDATVADIAHNVKLWHGRLDPWRTPLQVKAATGIVSAHIRDCCWRASSEDCVRYVDILCGPTIISSPNCLPTVIHDWCNPNEQPCPLSFPCPEKVSTQHTPSGGQCHTDHVRSYVVAYGDECEMGAPSPFSDPVYCASHDDVVSLSLPGPPSDVYCNVSKLYIYRLVTTLDTSNASSHQSREHRQQGDALPAASDAVCVLVGCVDVEQTTYVDTGYVKEIDDACDTLCSEDYESAPCGLVVHGMFDSGALVGSIGSTLKFSEFNTFHGWPPKYDIEMDCKIIEVCVCDNFAFVFTERGVEIVNDTLDALDTFCRPKTTVKRALPLLNHKAVLCLNGQAIFATLQGLYQVSGDGSTRNLSGTMGTDNWQQMDPATMRLGLYQNRLMITSDRFSGIYDIDVFNDGTPASNTLSTIDACPKCYVNDKQGNLYYITDDGIYQWDKGDDYLCMHWRSAEREYPGFTFSTAARVDHPRPFGRKQSSHKHTDISIYADGCKVFSRPVNHNNAFRQPKCRAHSFAVEVQGDRSVSAVTLASSIRCMGANAA